MDIISETDRARAALLALAIGDAMGAPVELWSSQQIKSRYGGDLDDVYGLTTDDTAQTLALARAIETDYSEEKAISNYVKWFQEDAHGIGSNSRFVLQAASQGKDPRKSARQFLREKPLRKPSNGALMRCVPLALRYYKEPQKLMWHVEEDTTLTHAHELCLASVSWLAQVLANLLLKQNPLSVEKPQGVNKSAWKQTLEAANRDLGQQDSDWWVYENRSFTLVPIAMVAYALKQEFSCEKGMIWAVNMGGDADTNAALVGAVLAMQQGTAALPERWQSAIDIKPELFYHADRLIKLAKPNI